MCLLIWKICDQICDHLSHTLNDHWLGWLALHSQWPAITCLSGWPGAATANLLHTFVWHFTFPPSDPQFIPYKCMLRNNAVCTAMQLIGAVATVILAITSQCWVYATTILTLELRAWTARCCKIYSTRCWAQQQVGTQKSEHICTSRLVAWHSGWRHSAYEWSYPTLGLVSTGMTDHLGMKPTN